MEELIKRLLRLKPCNERRCITFYVLKGLAKATVAYSLLTLVRRVRALDAPAAGVIVTRAIRTLKIVDHRPSALKRGVCCCRCGSEMGHRPVPSRWVSLVQVRTKSCCIRRGQRMVVKLFG